MVFPSGWNRKQKITIQSSQVSGTASHTNFPVLITLNHLKNSKAFNKANNVIPEGLKRNIPTGKSLKEISSLMADNTTSQISENIQNQRIGNDVGTFDDTFPEFNDVAKQRINATTKQEILDWWDAYWK